MRKLILFFIIFCCVKVNAQVYQLMPQYGYQAPRFAIDSTLQIPTVCGVPTLKSVQFATKKGAIAYDSCNAVFYTYSPKTQTWSALSGGGGSTDTTSLSNRINLKLNILDTSNMLSKYLRKIDTATLSNRINLKVPYTGATQDVDLGAFKISAQSFQVEGTNGLGHIHFKHQNSDATATGQSTALFANSNGDLKYKNAGNYYSTLKTQQTADRIYTFQNKSYTLADSSDLTSKLNSADTASLSNRINLKLNIADTSAMLSKYLRKTDTASLSNRINLKLNATDTASLSTRIETKLTDLDLLQSLSLGFKAEPYGCTYANVTSQLALTSPRLNFYPFNWNVSDSIRGIAFFNRATTTLTSTNYNGVAIYSLSGGTLTRLTFTANSGTFWDGTINTWKTNAITPYYLPKGVYYLGYEASGSAGTPTIASGTIMQGGLIEPPSAVNANGIKISSFISNATATPPSSVAFSTTTTLQQVPYFILY